MPNREQLRLQSYRDVYMEAKINAAQRNTTTIIYDAKPTL